jgi:hypothetical protein
MRERLHRKRISKRIVAITESREGTFPSWVGIDKVAVRLGGK